VDALSPTAELASRLASGDLRGAGEWLVSHYAADVVGLCRSMVRERELADDLAQDAFSAAFAGLRAYRGEAAPRTWLLAIARHRCIDQLRRMQREPWVDLGEDGNEPDHHADDAPLPPELLLRRTDVEAALGELAEGERALVVLRFRHGMEYPELASVFGLREGTVRMRLSRALGKMRERLTVLDAQELSAAAAPEAEAAARPAAPAPAFGAPRPARSAAPGGAPPPPPAAMAPPPARAKGRGLLGRLLGSAGPEPEARPAPATPFAAALTPREPLVGASLREKLEHLVASLPLP
jgi:RNA polymerase sigma-70 factor (ECF subfamily)